MTLDLLEVGFDDHAPPALERRLREPPPEALYCLDHETTLAAYRMIAEMPTWPRGGHRLRELRRDGVDAPVTPGVSAVRQPVEERRGESPRPAEGGGEGAAPEPRRARRGETARHPTPPGGRGGPPGGTKPKPKPRRGGGRQETPRGGTGRGRGGRRARGERAGQRPRPGAGQAADRHRREDRRHPVVQRHGGRHQAGGREIGVDAWMVGPTSADPALQVRAVEDLIAQRRRRDRRRAERRGARAGPATRAGCRDQGDHPRGPEQKNVDWNFELTSIEGFGEAHMELLAEEMGGKGKYACSSARLTVPLHNAWADAAIAYLKENHPDMELVGDRFGVAESVDETRKTTLDLLRAQSGPEGILAFGSQGPIGAARGAEHRKVAEDLVLGPFSPGQGREARQRRHHRGGFMWNPMTAGEVFVTLGTCWPRVRRSRTAWRSLASAWSIRMPEKRSSIVDQLVALEQGNTVDDLAELGL